MNDLSDPHIPLIRRDNPRARRLSLRVQAGRAAIVLTVPPKTPESLVRQFIAKSQPWLAQQQTRIAQSPALPFTAGTSLTVLGKSVTIHHDPAHKGAGMIIDDRLIVGGEAAFTPRRVQETLVRLAKSHLSQQVPLFAQKSGVTVHRVTLRDTTSRWGSCSASGNLSFAWRLVLAPLWVFDYVIAHEVAHRVHMNHSPAFWAVVATLSPHKTAARQWLKQNGATLHRYGKL